MRTDCKHIGTFSHFIECGTCTNRVSLTVIDCPHHGKTTLGKKADGYHCCEDCTTDYVPTGVTPPALLEAVAAARSKARATARDAGPLHLQVTTDGKVIANDQGIPCLLQAIDPQPAPNKCFCNPSDPLAPNQDAAAVIQMTFPGLTMTGLLSGTGAPGNGGQPGGTLNMDGISIRLKRTYPLAWGLGMFPQGMSKPITPPLVNRPVDSTYCLGAGVSQQPWNFRALLCNTNPGNQFIIDQPNPFVIDQASQYCNSPLPVVSGAGVISPIDFAFSNFIPYDGCWAGILGPLDLGTDYLSNFLQSYDWESLWLDTLSPTGPGTQVNLGPGPPGVPTPYYNGYYLKNSPAQPGKLMFGCILLCYQGNWYFWLWRIQCNPAGFVTNAALTYNVSFPGSLVEWGTQYFIIPPNFESTILLSACTLNLGGTVALGGIPITCANLPQVQESWSDTQYVQPLKNPDGSFAWDFPYWSGPIAFMSCNSATNTGVEFLNPNQPVQFTFPSTVTHFPNNPSGYTAWITNSTGSINLRADVWDDIPCGNGPCQWSAQYIVSIPGWNSTQGFNNPNPGPFTSAQVNGGYTFLLTSQTPGGCIWSTNNEFQGSNVIYQECTRATLGGPTGQTGPILNHYDFVPGGGTCTVQMQLDGGTATVSVISSIAGVLATWTGQITPFGGVLTLNEDSLNPALAQSVFNMYGSLEGWYYRDIGGAPFGPFQMYDLRPAWTFQNKIVVAAC